MTGCRSQSLGEHAYERLLGDAGLTRVASAEDEGENTITLSRRGSSVEASGRPGTHWEVPR